MPLRRVARGCLSVLAPLAMAGAAAQSTVPAPPAPPAAPVIQSYDTLGGALTGGKVQAHLRLRFENANDGGRPEESDVLSLRTAIGYRTGAFRGFSALVEGEDVAALGDYDDGGASRGMGAYAQVLDPEGIELNQGFLAWTGLPKTTLQAGRQLVLDREAPFHRYLGNVVWRQNWQTLDAVAIENTSLPATRARFWYAWNVNRIFGENNPTRGLDDKGLDGYLFNVQYGGFSLGKFEAYAYLLDFDDPLPAAGFYQSTQTVGARFDGRYPLAAQFDVLYTLEGAHQGDYADNPSDIDANFFWGALGGTWKPGGAVQALTLKVSYELLEGSGGADRYTTPLATLHPFQGWADQFLNTPGDGIEDFYVTFIGAAWGFSFTAVWHDFGANADDYDYGDEWDLELTRPFLQRYKAGIKYAAYDADRNALNVARNPVQRNDMERFWMWVEFSY